MHVFMLQSLQFRISRHIQIFLYLLVTLKRGKKE